MNIKSLGHSIENVGLILHSIMNDWVGNPNSNVEIFFLKEDSTSKEPDGKLEKVVFKSLTRYDNAGNIRVFGSCIYKEKGYNFQGWFKQRGEHPFEIRLIEI